MFDIWKHQFNRRGNYQLHCPGDSDGRSAAVGTAAGSRGDVNRPFSDPDSCAMQMYGHWFTHRLHLSSASNVPQCTLLFVFFFFSVFPIISAPTLYSLQQTPPASFILQICLILHRSYTVNNRHVINVYM